MIPRPSSSRRFLMLAAALSLGACAGVKVAPPTAPTPTPTPVGAPEPAVTMSPIPNPTAPHGSDKEKARAREGQKSDREAQPEPSSRAAKPAAPSRLQAPLAPAVDPAKAARLRERGLEQLNRGSIRNAVHLLTDASRLDPENRLIRRDLDRALRINRAVGDQP